MKVVFIHGGPGLNGNPERELLVAPYGSAGLELLAWDEPSSLRPEGAPFQAERAWPAWLESALAFVEQHAQAGPVTLMTHSFGAWVGWEIARERPQLVERVVYVAPALSTAQDHKNTLSHARDAFGAAGDEARSAQMSGILDAYSGSFDDNTRAGWLLALECAGIFDAYWCDKERMAAYLAHYAGAYGLDVPSFLGVSAGRPAEPAPGTSEVPASVIWGAQERIVDRALSAAHLRARHASLSEHTLQDAAHYPHIERADEVLRICLGSADMQRQ